MSSSDCIFCKILAREIPVEIVFESEHAIAFRDMNPQAPVHMLIIPRKHIATINDLDAGDEQAVGSLFVAAKQVAMQTGIAEDGYRVTMNCNAAAGQTVFHLHLHLLGGRQLGWPPG